MKDKTKLLRSKILEKAEQLVSIDREAMHGDPHNNFVVVAKLWTTWLGFEVTSKDVPMMMALFKVARAKSGERKDNYIDAAGYIALAAEGVFSRFDTTDEDKE